MKDIRVVKQALNGNHEINLKTLVLTIVAPETSPYLLETLHHNTARINLSDLII